MSKVTNNFQRLCRRALPLLLVFCILASVGASAVSAAFEPASDTGDLSKYSNLNISRWTRVTRQSDLEDGHTYDVIIAWGDKYYAGGVTGNNDFDYWKQKIDGVYSADDRYITLDEEEFFTRRNIPGAWRIKVVNTKSDEYGTRHMVRLYIPDSSGKYHIVAGAGTGTVTWDGDEEGFLIADKYASEYENDEMALWSLYTNDVSCKYDEKNKKFVTDGFVRFVRILSKWYSSNDHMFYKGSTLYVDYDDPPAEGLLRLYVRDTTTQIPAITKRTVVETGTTFAIDNNIYMDDGVELFIEPGAVVTVKGNFYNNGYITNCGTFIMEENARMFTFEPPKPSKSIPAANINAVYCMGGLTKVMTSRKTAVPADGNMIIMPGAVLECDDGMGTVELTDGANLVNFGGMVLPEGLKVSGRSVMTNKKDGKVITGYYVPENYLDQSMFTDMSEADYAIITSQCMQNPTYISLYSSSIIKNEGVWKNFCKINTDGSCTLPDSIKNKYL